MPILRQHNEPKLGPQRRELNRDINEENSIHDSAIIEEDRDDSVEIQQLNIFK